MKTALHIACEYGITPISEYLIEMGANKTSRDMVVLIIVMIFSSLTHLSLIVSRNTAARGNGKWACEYYSATTCASRSS